MTKRHRKSSGRMASKGYPNPIDVHVGKPKRLHKAEVDETRWLDKLLDSPSYTVHSGSQFRGSPAQRSAKQHQLSEDKNSRRRDRDLSWVLIAYLVGVAGLLSAAAYTLLS